MHSASLKLLTTLLLLAVTGFSKQVQIFRPQVSLSLARRVNVTSVHNLVRHDQSRARMLKAKGANQTHILGSRDGTNEALDNQAVFYVASIGIGSPPTNYSLLVDTGSSNTWVGAGQAYIKTSTSTQTSNKVAVTYSFASFSGTEFTDQLAISCTLVIPKQSIGVASRSVGFEGVDGILGIGPVGLTLDTLSPATTSTIPTVTDNLFSSGAIFTPSIGISFEPTTTDSILNGELTWGGVDSTKMTGIMNFAPITTTSPANQFWGINQSIQYGTSNVILSTTAGIVDTGTTLVLIATNALTKYKTATGATLDSTTSLLSLTSAQFSSLQSLFFIIGSTTYELTANAQLWPRSLNIDIGGVSSKIYLIVNDIGSNSGMGLDFINGFAFLERFYTVYDTTNKRVGFATTPFTHATTN